MSGSISTWSALTKRDKILGLGVVVLLLGALVAAVRFLFLTEPDVVLGYYPAILCFHIPTAWIAVLAFLMAAYWSLRYLLKGSLDFYHKSATSARMGLIFTILATISGAIYAKASWGAFWHWDIRQTTIFILLLIYAAYIVLGFSIEDEEKRARISSVYALLAFVTVPFLVFIIPRLTASTHPAAFEMPSLLRVAWIVALIACTALYAWLMRFYTVRRRCQDAEKIQNGDEQL